MQSISEVSSPVWIPVHIDLPLQGAPALLPQQAHQLQLVHLEDATLVLHSPFLDITSDPKRLVPHHSCRLRPAGTAVLLRPQQSLNQVLICHKFYDVHTQAAVGGGKVFTSLFSNVRD